LNDYLKRIEAERLTKPQPTTRPANVSDLLLLLGKKVKDHILINTLIQNLKETFVKLSEKRPLSPFETGLAKHVKAGNITTKTSVDDVLHFLNGLSKKELEGIVPEIDISIADIEQIQGCHMKLPRHCLLIPIGDGASLDDDILAMIFLTMVNALTFLHTSVCGLWELRKFSTAIRKGSDLSQLILLTKQKYTTAKFVSVFLVAVLQLFLPDMWWLLSVIPVFQLCYMIKTRTVFVPGEVLNFYILDGKKVYLKEKDGKAVHLDGTPCPQDVKVEFEIVEAKTPKVLERYAILYFTGRGTAFDKIKSFFLISNHKCTDNSNKCS
jgi:hypothetical protein